MDSAANLGMELTKDIVVNILQNYQCSGASEKTRQIYISRLLCLLKRGALQLLDQPERFKDAVRIDERPAGSNLSVLKAVIQFTQALLLSGQWYNYYQNDVEATTIAYRQLVRQMNVQEKAKRQTAAGLSLNTRGQ